VKPKIIPETGIQRTRTRLTVVLFSVIFAGYISGCFHTPTSIPEELSGKYITTHPGYEDEYFVISPEYIIMGFADGMLKHYDVKKVEKEIVFRRTLYTVLCANEDEGEEFNFVFFADLAGDGDGIIHFRNKPQVSWEKEVIEESYNDDSNA
jgi:hypothetical protein